MSVSRHAPVRRASMTSRLLLPVALLLLGAASVATAGAREEAQARNAVRVLKQIQAIPESAIPDKLIDEAHAIAVIPDTIKAGLFIGGRRGHGLLSVKTPEGTWSNPSFITLTGGSIGLQAGVQSSDIVLVFSSPRGLESIVNGKITLGADAGVAAGPVGRTASLATDGQMKAEIWSWSRARGLFAGVALDGAALTIDDEANLAVYGPGTTPRMIFEGRAGTESAAVVSFRDHLEEATAAARYARGTERPLPAAGVEATAGAGASVTVPATPTPVDPAAPPPRPTPFEPVPDESNPATVESLPPPPTPTP